MKEFVSKLKKPRRMMMLVMAGKPVDGMRPEQLERICGY